MVKNIRTNKIILIIFNLIFIIIIFQKNLLKEKELYTQNENIENSMIESAEFAKDFINKSMNGLLFNNQIFEYNNNPFVSVVIPIYNSEQIIIRTIRSIQNQNMNNIEIILVNDYSRDNTSFIIKNLQKKDKRILLINNNKNMGTLYSRCIGVLSSKGKYIFPLDNDDMFLDRDVFDIIYNVAKKNKLDIVKFNGIRVKGIDDFFKNRISNILFCKNKKNVIIYQPELSNFPIRRNQYQGKYILEDVYLWSKCIRTKIYKRAVSLYKKERYSIYVTSWEDNIINYILFQLANSFIFNPKYGILRIASSSSANSITPIIRKNLYEIFFLDAVFDFSKNSIKGKEIILNLIISLVNRPKFNNTLKSNNTKKYFKSIIEKIFNCKYIIKKDKYFIKKIVAKYNLYK